MSMGEPAEIFWRGADMAIGFLVALGWTAWLRRRDIPALAGLALLAGFTFVMWKHGFVRGRQPHGHFLQASRRSPWWRGACSFSSAMPPPRPGRRLNAVVPRDHPAAAALAGSYSPLRPSVRHLGAAFWPTFRHHLNCLVHPFAHRQELEAKLKDQRELNQLPAVGEPSRRSR